MKQQNDTNFFASESDQDRVSVNMSGDILVRRAFNANPNQLKDEDWQNNKLDVFYQFIFEVIRDFKRDGYLNIDEEYYPIMSRPIVMESSDMNNKNKISHVAFEAKVKCRKEVNVPTKH